MALNNLLLCSFLLFALSIVAVSADEDCVYTLYVRTSTTFKAGTDSIISVRLYNAYGEYVEIRNLETWGGLMGPGYNYFERGNLDIFSGRAPCLSSSPICALNLTSDGSGPGSSWYCNYVEVTVTGVHARCSQQQFTIEQWLSVKVPPYELTAIRNYCPSADVADLKLRRHRHRFESAVI
ncbi:hypothetical protein JCGZ_24066 [Jatropha curcas]|uniref:PLAT domain-containing protein n=1 Tax=Jatropha curcas TaxID=180498 RepID=A0A067LEP9_JATCU|nr:PLAT domain-containing protein 2 [Jatropha curcas]KDP46857.1 hypothetical protein JCGZ_24066 [Jatropha curcas]